MVWRYTSLFWDGPQRALGVPHPSMSDRCSLGTVESHGATRRCLAPRGTASSDAVPQQNFVQYSAILRPPVNAPSGRGRTRPHSPIFCSPPYFFGMVINSGLSHKCQSQELRGDVGRLTRSNWECMWECMKEQPV